MQRIDDVGGKAFVKQKSEDVVAVASGRLKPYFLFISQVSTVVNHLQQCTKSLRVVWIVDASARISPSELRMKQSRLPLATSIPAQIMINTSGVFI